MTQVGTYSDVDSQRWVFDNDNVTLMYVTGSILSVTKVTKE